MDNNENQSQERVNKFIFSDDFYDDMPLEQKGDVTKPVKPFNQEVKRNDNKGFMENMDTSVDRLSGLNDLINGAPVEDANTFNFFGHNANIQEDIIEQIETPIVEEEKKEDAKKENKIVSMFNSLDLPFNKPKEVEDENVIHLDSPTYEDNFNIEEKKEEPVEKETVYEAIENVDTSDIADSLIDNIIDYDAGIKKKIISDENKPEEKVEELLENPHEKKEQETVTAEGLDDQIVSNIVDYQTSLPYEQVIPDNDNKFIKDGETNPEERKRIVTSDIMSGVTKSNSLNVESGINTDLENELMEQKRIRDEEEKARNKDDYSGYTAPIDPTQLVYKAGGKSYIKEKEVKIKPSKTLEDMRRETAPEAFIEQPIKEEKQPESIQDLIEKIINVDDYFNLGVKIDLNENPGFQLEKKDDLHDIVATEETIVYDEKTDNFNYDQNFDNVEVVKSDLLDVLAKQAKEENRISILARYGEDFCAKDYITNPAIGRADEIKQLILILLTPEKSGILTGKPGIGKTSIVEGLAYQLQRNNVPDALKGYRIVSVKTPSLLGSLPTGETRLQTLVDELKDIDKTILFIDEIHMLIGATSESSMDFANMFKESLGRGTIKVIGATTTEEYERYILRDKAFVRRFQKVEVEEPDRTHTIKILMGTYPKIEHNTGAKLKYSEFIQTEIMGFLVDITTEYKRIYGIGSRYPDICITLLAQAFSQAVFANRKEVNILDIRKAIEHSKNIYPDVIKKELVRFDQKFKDIIDDESR